MRKLCFGLSFIAMVLLIACGEDSSSKVEEPETDEIVAESVDDLPTCTKKREGEKARTDEGNYVCKDGAWKAEAEEIPSYETEEDVPACTKKKEGSLVYVEDTGDTLICESGEWKNVDDSDDDDGSDDDGTTEGESSSSNEETDAESSSSSKEESSSSEDSSSNSEGGSSGSEDSSSSSEEKSSNSEISSSNAECVEGNEIYVGASHLRCVNGQWVLVSGNEEESSSSISSSNEQSSSSDAAMSSSVECVKKDTETSFVDRRDCQEYKFVEINGQTWMAENLNYNAAGSSCYEQTSGEGCQKIYGRVYDWVSAVNKTGVCSLNELCGLKGTIQGACPDGWHLPSFAEWTTLIDYISKWTVDVSTRLKSKTDWITSNLSDESLWERDFYGFNALPVRSSSVNNYGYSAYFWLSTENDATRSWVVYLTQGSKQISRNTYSKKHFYSVRCLKNEANP